jgi:hypothetical protein
MKTIALSLLLSLTVAAPAFAEPARPAPAPVVAEPAAGQPTDNAAALIDETAIADATTPEARRALLIRCSGPPPRPTHVAKAEPPKAEPVDISLDPNFK